MVATSIEINAGMCFVLFAYEVGFAIDLVAAEQRISAQRETLKQKRRAPTYFQYQPPPLRVTQQGGQLAVGRWWTGESVDIVLYDFGAVAVTYRIPLSGPLADVVHLSGAVHDHQDLLADSRQRVEQVTTTIQAAISKPEIATVVETYAIFELAALEPPCRPEELYTTRAQEVARILRSEHDPLSGDEVSDAVSLRIAYGCDDVAIIDWDGAVLYGSGLDDVRAVLEFANVELLQMRYLDRRLDDALDEAYGALSRRAWRRFPFPGAARGELRRVAELQVDSAILFEGVNNALKLLGDQYLARVYRLASQRFHLTEWDTSILRKIEVLESIYEKLSDAATGQRMEVLEWIIIVLIALSIVIALVIPGAH